MVHLSPVILSIGPLEQRPPCPAEAQRSRKMKLWKRPSLVGTHMHEFFNANADGGQCYSIRSQTAYARCNF